MYIILAIPVFNKHFGFVKILLCIGIHNGIFANL